MYKKEIPKLNKENFPAWQSLMKLHITGMENVYTKIVGTLNTKQLKARKEHNHAMLEIVFALSYSEYEDVKGCANEKIM